MTRRWLVRGVVALAAMAAIAGVAYGLLLIPSVYFQFAFFIIQRNALTRDSVDWVAARRDAEQLLEGARTTGDTYPAIRLVLQRLGDHHSHLASPEAVAAMRAGAGRTLGLTAMWPERVVATVSPEGPADGAGIRPGDLIESVDGDEPAHVGGVVLLPRDRPTSLRLQRPGSDAFTARLTPRVVPFNRPATVRRLHGGLGYIDVPAVVGGGGSFDAEAIAAIRDIDAEPICGWVVDLRRNFGGNMWPMLHALRPILGEGNPFTYRYGKAPWANGPVYSLRQPTPAIAVLTSRLTVSSGELVTIAFRGPATTSTFGEPTGGLSTSNTDIPLVDGAVLVVTTSRAADRLGREYEGAIQPDHAVAIDWTRLGTDDDPVIEAATRWLEERPPCLGSR